VQDLDPLDRIKRHRHVTVVMPGLRIVQPHAVDQHQHLPEMGAADREVRLQAAHAAGAHVDRRRQPEHVRHTLHRELRDLLARNHRHRAGNAPQLHRRRRGGDNDGLTDGILGVGGDGAEQ
jgi:hypothetical protein